MQDRSDAGQEGRRTRGMQDRMNEGQEGRRTGGILDTRYILYSVYAGQEGCGTGGIQSGGIRKGVMQDRRDAVTVPVKFIHSEPDSDPELDPHQCKKRDPNPHQNVLNPPNFHRIPYC